MVGHGIEVGTGLHADMALQVGRRVEDEECMGNRAGSGSGLHDGREYDVPRGGAALVRA